MTPSHSRQPDSNNSGRPPPMKTTPRSKSKALMSTLRRLLTRTSSQLRDVAGSPSALPGSSASLAAPGSPSYTNDTQVVIAPASSKALPRPVTSTPLLKLDFPPRSAAWPSPKNLLQSRFSARRLVPAPSMSALSPVPDVNVGAPPFSTGAMPNTPAIQHSMAVSAISDRLQRCSPEDAPPPVVANRVGTGAHTAIPIPLPEVHRRRDGAGERLFSYSRDGSTSPLANNQADRPTPCASSLAGSVPLPSSPFMSADAHFHDTATAPVMGICPAASETTTAVAPAAAAAAAAAAAVDGKGANVAAAAASPSTLLAVCPSAPQSMLRPVWRLSDYAIGGRLYKGEVSSVYKAVCRLSGCRVVLKVYSVSRVADNALHTLVREVRIHTDLDHENVLAMYGVFEEADRLVLVLERALRGDLFHLHRSLPNFRMSEDQLRVLVLAPLLEALVYMHGRGVCHRDIKPENLLMTSGWQLRVADFGAAINLTQERAVTRTGTMDYMAPEVERCPLKMLPEDNKDNPQLAYSTAADVWSVGVLAYEMMVGFPPFVNCGGADEAPDSGGSGGGSGGGRPRELSFPHFVSAGGQDFITCALAERPGDRPTAVQLLRHPWLKHAVRQHKARRQQQRDQEVEQMRGRQPQPKLQPQQSIVKRQVE